MVLHYKNIFIQLNFQLQADATPSVVMHSLHHSGSTGWILRMAAYNVHYLFTNMQTYAESFHEALFT